MELRPSAVAEEAVRRLASDLEFARVPTHLQLRKRSASLHPAAPPGWVPRDHEICLRLGDRYAGRYRFVDSDPLEPQVARIAVHIQDDVVEELVQIWPPCPGHVHSAAAELRCGGAVWVCPTGGHVVARVGALRGE